MDRWTDRLLAEGSDPDPRFTLANERTFLAWIRTALAVIAGGVGVALTGALLAVATVCGAISLQLRRTVKRHPRRTPHHLADPASALLMTVVTVLFAVMGLLFALEA